MSADCHPCRLRQGGESSGPCKSVGVLNLSLSLSLRISHSGYLAVSPFLALLRSTRLHTILVRCDRCEHLHLVTRFTGQLLVRATSHSRVLGQERIGSAHAPESASVGPTPWRILLQPGSERGARGLAARRGHLRQGPDLRGRPRQKPR